MSNAYTHGWNSSINAYVGGPAYSSDFATQMEWWKGRLDALRKFGVLTDESPARMQAKLGTDMFQAIYGE